MKLKLIEVKINDETQYLVEPTIFAQKTVTKNPLEAKNYNENEQELKEDLDMLFVKGDEVYARSGLKVDSIPMIVELEVQVKELSRVLGREVRSENKIKP